MSEQIVSEALCRNQISGSGGVCAGVCGDSTVPGQPHPCEHALTVWRSDAQEILRALLARVDPKAMEAAREIVNEAKYAARPLSAFELRALQVARALLAGEGPVRSSGESNSVAAGAAPLEAGQTKTYGGLTILELQKRLKQMAESHDLYRTSPTKIERACWDLLAEITCLRAPVYGEQVERTAKAIYAVASGEERPDFDRQPASVKRFYFQQARAAIVVTDAKQQTKTGVAQASDSLARPSSSPSPAVRDVTLREALEQCAAEWKSPPCTVSEGAIYLYQEFARRAEIARAALSPLSPPEGGKP